MIEENLPKFPLRAAMLGELKHGRYIWPWVERGYFDGHQAGETTTVWTRGAAWLFRPIIRFMARRDLADKARVVEAASMLRSQRPRVSMQHSAGTRSLPSTIGLIEAGDRSAAFIGLAASGVALRRYKLDHGTYPNTLEELVPSYLRVVPFDPFTERPQEYKRQGAGFELRLQIPPGAVIAGGVKNEKIAARPFGEWKISQ
jgi:hypothetical protein